MRGRKPTPPYLKLLKGNPGKRAIRPTVGAQRPLEPPPPPDYLRGHAKQEWIRVSPELFALGCLTNLDTAAFGAYCTAYSTWRTAAEAFERVAAGDPVMAGLIVKGDGGSAVKNPLLTIERNAAETMVRIASEFGMTAAARARISVGAPTGPGKFDGLLGRY
jgi:P27 family predicted phage terminase small subunit